MGPSTKPPVRLAYRGVPLGVLPAGTANVLSMELGLGSHLGPAIERLTKCLPQRIAMGKFTACGAQPRYFLCMAGAGLDAKVVSQIDPALKDRTGKLAYWTAGLAQVVSAMEQLDVRIPCDGVPDDSVPDHGVLRTMALLFRTAAFRATASRNKPCAAAFCWSAGFAITAAIWKSRAAHRSAARTLR